MNRPPEWWSGPPLIGLAHGSRDPRAAHAIGRLMSAVTALRPGLVTSAAFLDLCEPDLEVAVGTLGAPRVIVVPLLFAQAFHAKVDVPQAVSATAERSGKLVTTSEILGVGPDVLAALMQQADDVGIDSKQEILLLAVGTSDPVANQAVDEMAARWASTRQAPVRAVFATSAPRAMEALEQPWRTPPAIASLFLAPGLLLDQVSTRATELGVLVTPPLGVAMAQLVLDRYDAALR